LSIALLVLGGLSGLLLVFEEASAYTVRGTIVIEGDMDFTVGNGVSGGSGTEIDPYIIDGWEIDGGGEGRCIYVGNTTKHFIIRNCNLTNASGNANQYYRNAGISLYNATNVTIENCIFSGNGHGIYIDTSSGFTVIGNVFENCDYGIYLYTNEEGLDRDYTMLDMVIRDNEFEMSSNNDAVYFYIELDYNGNGQHDANIGNIDISDNDIFMNGTSADGIHIQDIGVFELVDGSINMGDVTISGNRIFGGSRGIYFDGYFYYYTNVTLDVGNVTVNGNVLLGQSTCCIYMNYYDVEDMYGTTKATLGNLIINDNRMISDQNTVNGIYMDDYAYWEYLSDEARITVGDLIVEENVIDVDGYGIYVYYSYAGFDMEDNTGVTMGNVSIRNNTMFNSSYGIYFEYEYVAGAMSGNAMARFGVTTISGNLINSTSDAIYFYYYHISYDMDDNASASLGKIIISDNQLNSNSRGIYFDRTDYSGYDMFKSSSFHLGGILITRNQINSRSSTLYFDHDYLGYNLKNKASMTTGEITILDNRLTSGISETTYFYLDDSANNLFNRSSVIMGNITLANNTITSISDCGLYVEYSCGGVGSNMEGDSYARLPKYFIAGNTFNVDREGVYFDQYYMGVDNHDRAAVDIGAILIDNNTFVNGTGGVDITIEEIHEGYNSTTVTVDGIIISNNDFRNLTNDAINLFFDDFGYGFNANEVLSLGDIRIEENLIEGCDDGIYVDYRGLFSESYANVTIGDLCIFENEIRECSNNGIYVYYYLDADDYSNLSVGTACISGNSISNISNDGIYLYNRIEHEAFATAEIEGPNINNNTISNCSGVSSYGVYMAYVQNALISDNIVMDCYNGIGLREAHNTSVLRNIARSNQNIGLNIHSSNDNTVSLSSFTHNRDGIHVNPSANVDIHTCSIHNNTEFGVNATNNGGYEVHVSENWWGSDTGPFHPINNSGGNGDNVTGYTEVGTWLTAPILIITSQDKTETLEDEHFSVEYEALDVDGNPVNWSLNTISSWLSMDPVTGVLSGTPGNDDVGSHTVNISVTDAFGGEDWTYFILSVENVNDAPNITTADVSAVLEDVPYSVDYNATDIDPTGDILTWSLNTTAAWLSLNSSSGLLSGVPTNEELGAYGLNVSVSDGNGGVDWHNFTVVVTNVNDAPIISGSDVSNATEDELYSVHYEAADVDPTNDTLSWDLHTNAPWLSINGTSGGLSGVPANADVGDSWVNVSCSDDHNGTDWTNFTLTVTNVNDAPIIITTDNVSATQYRLYSVDYMATDIDPTNDTLSWNLETNASWLYMNSSTGVLSGTPTNMGTYPVKVTVGDGNGGTDSHDFMLKVVKGNSPPIITTAALPKATEGEPYSFQIEFSDLEEDTVTWEMTTNADWLSIDLNTGLLAGTPPMGSKGEYWVNISTTDGHGNTAYNNFTLSVIEGGSGDITSIGEIVVREGEIRVLTYVDTSSGTFLEVKTSGSGTLIAAKIEEGSDMVAEDLNGYGRISFYLQLTFTGDMNWTNITISFADIDLNESLDYHEAKIFYFDGSLWMEAENTGVDFEKRVVWANVTHFTIFAGFAPVKKGTDVDGEEGGEEAWYKSQGAIITAVVILMVIVLLGVFLYIRTRKGEEKETEDGISEKIGDDEGYENEDEEEIAEVMIEGQIPEEDIEEGMDTDKIEGETEEEVEEEKEEKEEKTPEPGEDVPEVGEKGESEPGQPEMAGADEQALVKGDEAETDEAVEEVDEEAVHEDSDVSGIDVGGEDAGSYLDEDDAAHVDEEMDAVVEEDEGRDTAFLVETDAELDEELSGAADELDEMDEVDAHEDEDLKPLEPELEPVEIDEM